VLYATGLALLLAGRGLPQGPLHTLTTVAVCGLLAGHVFMAVLNPTTRHALRGMTFGDVDRDWAKHHHPLWVAAVDREATVRRSDLEVDDGPGRRAYRTRRRHRGRPRAALRPGRVEAGPRRARDRRLRRQRVRRRRRAADRGGARRAGRRRSRREPSRAVRRPARAGRVHPGGGDGRRAGGHARLPARPGGRAAGSRPRGRDGDPRGGRAGGAGVHAVGVGDRLDRLPRYYGLTTTLSAAPLLMRGNASGVSSSETTSVTTPRMLAAFCSSMSSACTWSR